MQFLVRTLGTDDLDEVLLVQASCYRTDLLESRLCFAQKLEHSPSSCFGAFSAERLLAYVFSHPWREGVPVQLDSHAMNGPLQADCVYIHDMAITPEARGQGIADALVHAVQSFADSRGLTQFALVAVQDSEAFWERLGFLRVRAMQYGGGNAHYMLLRGQLCPR